MGAELSGPGIQEQALGFLAEQPAAAVRAAMAKLEIK